MKSDEQIELRKKLMRRLLWKTPLIIALVSFAVWWQLNHNTEPGASKGSTAANSQLSAVLAGAWTAEVTYGAGERRREEFFFLPEGERLYGTASFLGIKRGIEDGKVIGAFISFVVRFDEVLDQIVRERQLRYEAKLEGKELHVKLFDDKGNPPVEFSLAKSASGQSAAGK